jgi:hypothetical protein
MQALAAYHARRASLPAWSELASAYLAYASHASDGPQERAMQVCMTRLGEYSGHAIGALTHYILDPESIEQMCGSLRTLDGN